MSIGRQLPLPTIFELFRIVAWKLIYHNTRLANLGPEYDGCPVACRRPEADMERGCPDCQVTQLHEEFKEEVEEELQILAVKKEYIAEGYHYKWKWTMQKLVADVAFISTVNAGVDGKGVKSDWTVPIRTLVLILREEISSHQRAEAKEKEANRDT